MAGKDVAEKIERETFNCKQAAERHGKSGADGGRKSIASMCLKGKALAKKYGGASRVPVKLKQSAIFAIKVGREWSITREELDRVFKGAIDPK